MSEESEFTALLADYEEARDDERYFVALQGTALTLALTALSLLGALAVMRWRDQSADDPSAVPDVVIAGAPLIVLAILAYVQSAGAQAVIRSFSMRALEREIRSRLPESTRLDSYPELRVISMAELQATYAAMGTSATTRGSTYYRFMASWIFIAAWIAFGGMVIALSLSVSLPWRMTMIPFYLLAALVIFGDTLRINRHGRDFFADQVGVAAERLGQDLLPRPRAPRPRGTRTLAGYLLIPRPDDLVKVVFVLAGMFFGWLSTWGEERAATAGELALFVVAVEYLVYQSRYQWNDIRGVHEDLRAPDTFMRGRLPGGARNVGSSLTVMLIRIYMVLVIVAVGNEKGDTFSSQDTVLISSILLVYLLALPYELVRSRARMTQECSAGRLRFTLFLVGLGYPLRFGLGWLALGGDVSIWFFVSLAGIWGLGLAFVSLTWILEAGSYVSWTVVSNDTGVREFGGSPETPIRIKPHLLALFIAVGFNWTDKTTDASVSRTDLDGKNVKWLLQVPRTSQNIRSPWIIGAAVYFASLGLSGGSLVGSPNPRPVIACILAVGLLALLGRYRGDLEAHIIASLTMMTGFWIAGNSLTSSAPQVLVFGALFLLSALPTLIYIVFRSQSYSSTRQGAQQLVWMLASLLRGSYRWFVGKSPEGADKAMTTDAQRSPLT